MVFCESENSYEFIEIKSIFFSFVYMLDFSKNGL